MTENQDKDTVRAERRRRVGSGPRERAEAPQRRETGSETQTSSGGESRPPSTISSGGGLPFGKGGKSSLVGILVLLFIVCVFIAFGGKFNLFGSDSQNPEQNSDLENAQEALTLTDQAVSQPISPTVTKRPKTTSIPVSGGETKTWTVMLYQDADDNVLEQDIYLDLNEAERIGSIDSVNIIAQTDRFRGAYQGDGNWTGTKRYYITQDDDLNKVNSTLLSDLGEMNMSDPNTLVDFVTSTISEYPADNYVLVLSDHGMGWPGGWSDLDPGGNTDRSSPLASRLDNHLILNRLDQALTEIRNQAGIDKFELIGMDACLMGQLEVVSMLQKHAKYAVVSEEIEPALGWAYKGFLEKLVNNPGMDGNQLSQVIVDSYIVEDQRIVDDQARAEFLRQSMGAGGIFGQISSDQLTQQLEQGITLSAVDLNEIPYLINALNDFAYQLQSENQSLIARARTYAQSFTSIFGTNVPPSYIDIGNFVKLILKETRNQNVQQSANQLLDALQNVIVAEKHGPKKPGSMGLSIYFPNSQLYNNPLTGPESYTPIAEYFTTISLWDDFLAFHYNNQSFDPNSASAVIPDRTSTTQSPGLGEITISTVTTSLTEVSLGEITLLSADISGKNIGYIYLFVGYFDQVNNSINIIDMDYLESDEIKEVDGIYYPVWSESDSFTLEFEWEPVVFAIQVGEQNEVALFRPKTFGKSFREAVYSVEGIYHFADGSAPINARLLFSNGSIQQVYGISGGSDAGAPREIIPQAGDSFTIFERWLDLDENGNIKQSVSKEAATFSFSNELIKWISMDAAAGDYIVGFIVEDLDGNAVQSFSQVKVK